MRLLRGHWVGVANVVHAERDDHKRRFPIKHVRADASQTIGRRLRTDPGIDHHQLCLRVETPESSAHHVAPRPRGTGVVIDAGDGVAEADHADSLLTLLQKLYGARTALVCSTKAVG